MLDQRPFSLWEALLLALALLLGSGGPVAAEDSPRVVVGRVTRIDADSDMVGDQIGFRRTGRGAGSHRQEAIARARQARPLTHCAFFAFDSPAAADW